jgi:hypothetical protein
MWNLDSDIKSIWEESVEKNIWTHLDVEVKANKMDSM